LSELVLKLNLLSDEDLKKLGDKGKQKKEDLEKEEISKLHLKHKIKP